MKYGAYALLLVGVTALAWYFTLRPGNDRPWKPEHAVQATAAFEDSLVHVSGIRDFVWGSGARAAGAGPDRSGYYDKTFNLNHLDTVWFIVSVFNIERRGPAHTFVSFGFDDGSYVAISVEARQEVGESYSVLWGLFKQYEVIYVVGSERDLIGTRAIDRTDQVYLYPVRAPKQSIRALFTDMLRTATRLSSEPEFYNTLTNNCTTRIRDHVNFIRPGRVPASYKVLLPGYADELATDLGLIDSDMDVEAARKRYHINDRARQFAEAPDFSARIRQPIPRM
jgi:hypothetical protein